MSKMYLNGTVYGGAELPSAYACDLLCENTDFSVTSGTSDVIKYYTLKASIENYDAVEVFGYLNVKSNERNQLESLIIPRSEYYTGGGNSYTYLMDGSIGGNVRRFMFCFTNATQIMTNGNRGQSGEEPKLYKVYGIKFGGYATHDYSTEEHVVGKWIDGKTLYEKTFYYDNTNGITDSGQNDYEVATIPNIIVRNASGSMMNATNGNSYGLPYSVGTKGISICYTSSNKLYLRNVGDTWGSNWKFYITIQYTKTT